jgi:acetylornithine aminotransferase/acetylornithine/N-succinyldiaminopimelate aminotransferase
MKQHIIVNRTSETVLRFLPPYILERAHVDRAIAALDGILTTLTLNSATLAGRVPAGEDSHG